ncbi:Rne/Rng family ribonuclease [Phycicoccus sp. 3266]|uniref:Rne/Rng family ribonuclease n=1 Tax=Phycicoccus sp. 3266 TaxID=2817751 RepID=UPI0028669351|nr:Rne/Rng family ribonuclease [Phycicoccus sp. 3266]MDR6864415.1 ribonuclease E [Phycicoccus sp. 3266]
MASTDDQPTTPTTDGAPAGAAETSAPARRPRRATKKAAAPAPAAPAGEAADATSAAGAQGADAGAPAEPATGEVPAKKAAKRAPRKSAKKAAKASAGEPAVEPAAESAAVEPVAEATEAPERAKKAAKRAPRKSAKKAAKAPAGEPAVEPAPETPDEEDEEALAAARAEEARLAEGAAEPDTASAATVPSFGVLFQAPDPDAAKPARKRATRKRATAPAQEVEPAAQRAAEPVEAVEAPADDEAAEAAASADAGETAESGEGTGGRRRRRRGGKGRGRGRGSDSDARDESQGAEDAGSDDAEQADGNGPAEDSAEGEGSSSSRRRRRRRRSGSATDGEDPPGTVTKVREPRRDEPQSVKGSTRLEAKKQRRREGREAGRRRTIITEAEFLARRESVDRVMVVREREGKTQIGVLEDEVLVEHYVSRETNASMAGNVYLGRVQNVLPSMEAAFVDIGKGRNAVLYAGEVNWDAAGLENNQPKRIENALKSGDTVLVQVTKDPIGHKGARLTSQISLPGRYLVYVPEGSMTGISRKLPDTERARLKGILKEVVPDSAGVIVRTAAEGASEEELRADVERLTKTWEKIRAKADSKGKAKGGAPALVHGEPDLTVRVIRDVFNEDFGKLVVAGDRAWEEVSEYIGDVAPDLAGRLEKWTGTEDLFTRYRVDEQIAKAMDRKVWLPSGGSLVIDRTEAMTVVDVNTGKFVGSGGNLEETVTKNNIEAAEEIVRQLRLRDIGGIIVIDFIDMVLESNRDLVVRRLLECLGRDRTKHQVAEVTSLGLVQMTRKRVGSGLIEVFSETCDHCGGRGIIVHDHPVEKSSNGDQGGSGGARGGSGSERASSTSGSTRGRRGRSGSGSGSASNAAPAEQQQAAHHGGPTPAQIAAAAHAAALKSSEAHPFGAGELVDEAPAQDEPVVEVHETPDQEQPERVEAEPVQPEPAEREAAPARQAAAEPAQPERTQPEPARPAAAAAPTAAPRRRKRARVVAPAGPPRPTAAAADEAPAEPAPDAS